MSDATTAILLTHGQVALVDSKDAAHIGYFADEVDAALAYDLAALLQYGDFAKPNFLEA